ncbi:MAG: SDR family oxidoreductase [Planctomycetota bacterium]
MSLEGKVALVTGAARRVGRQIALELADAGAHVVVHYLNSAREAEQTVEAIRAVGRRALALRGDLAVVREIEGFVAEAVDQMGRIDILVNSASAFFPTRFGATRESEWDDLLDVNLKGPFFLSQLAAAVMTAAGGGQIVNITDVSVERPWTRYLPYCISKAGLDAMTRGLARALAPAIRVNAVAPGPVLLPEDCTPQQREEAIRQTLLGREGDARDVALAVRFLVDGPDFITGAVVAVDGGRRLA